MTWAMHAVVWRDVGDEAKAAEAFRQAYFNYTRPPLYTWHEGAGVEGSASQVGGWWMLSKFPLSRARVHARRPHTRYRNPRA